MIQEVFGKLERTVLFRFHLGKWAFDISNTVAVCWVITAVLILLAFFAGRGLKEKPGKAQNVTEFLVESVNGMCESAMGRHWKTFAPYIFALTLFLFFSNIAALFNFMPWIRMYPPTKDMNVTGTLSLMSLILILYASFRYKGVKGWLRSLADPMPLIAPFKLLEYVTKPVSLCLRLFGNILAGFVIMEMVFKFLPWISEPFSLYFDIFDGALHAFVFAYLTTLYIGEALE